MGRTHDFYCARCDIHWSPFTFDVCPGCGKDDESTYDLNHELGGDAA